MLLHKVIIVLATSVATLIKAVRQCTTISMYVRVVTLQCFATLKQVCLHPAVQFLVLEHIQKRRE